MYKKTWYILRSSSTPSEPEAKLTQVRNIEGTPHTVDPWIGTDDSSLRKLQLFDLGLDAGIFQRNSLHRYYLVVVTRSMLVGSQAYIALYPLFGETDDCLVEFVLMGEGVSSIVSCFTADSQCCECSRQQNSSAEDGVVLCHCVRHQDKGPSTSSQAPVE